MAKKLTKNSYKKMAENNLWKDDDRMSDLDSYADEIEYGLGQTGFNFGDVKANDFSDPTNVDILALLNEYGEDDVGELDSTGEIVEDKDVNGDGDTDVTAVDVDGDGDTDATIIDTDSPKEAKEAVKESRKGEFVPETPEEMKLLSFASGNTGEFVPETPEEHEIYDTIVSDETQKNIISALSDCKF